MKSSNALLLAVSLALTVSACATSPGSSAAQTSEVHQQKPTDTENSESKLSPKAQALIEKYRSQPKMPSDEIAECYEEVLLPQKIGGALVVRAQFEADGTISGVEFPEAKLATPKMKACVRERIVGWKTEAPEHGAQTVERTYGMYPEPASP